MASKVSLKLFPLFAEFPAEIRLMIWEEAAREPRTVILCPPPLDWKPRHRRWLLARKRTKEQEGLTQERGYQHPTAEKEGSHAPTWYRPLTDDHGLGWWTPTLLPALLHTNREARSIALRAYTLYFAWEGQPPAVWINFDVDAVLLSAAACFGPANPSHFACPLARQKMWLTTADMELVQRVIACDIKPLQFLDFLAMPRRPPWDLWLPKRRLQADQSARKGLMGSLESWTSVHTGPAQCTFQPRLCQPPSGTLRKLSWSCKRTWARARAWGARLRAPGAEERVFISHLSGACVVTHVAVPGHGLHQGGGVFRGQPNEQMVKAGKVSSVTVNGFCYQDVLPQRGDAWVAAWKKEWRCHADGKDLVVPCSRSESARPAPRVSGLPLNMVRIFHSRHYGNDLQLVVGPGGASRGHSCFDQTNQEDASTKIPRAWDCRPFYRRHLPGAHGGNT